MRKPKTPPNHDHFLRFMTDKDRMLAAIRAINSPLVDGKYLHWDQLLRYSPPADLSHEDWWHGLKFQRMPTCTRLPLASKLGGHFSYTLVNLIPEHLHWIDLQAGGSIEMPGDIANENSRDRYIFNSLLEEAITSSQIEGATTTRQVAKDMLRTGRPPRDRSERMIFNNFVTMQHINEIKNRPLTKDIVFELHRLVTEETLNDPDAAGRFRRNGENIYVAGDNDDIHHVPPSADELNARMDAMCAFANGETPEEFVHPAIRSIALHFWLAYDHPFVDGNGRTARALFYWSMLHHGYWLFEFLSISHIIQKAPSKYSRAFLYTETDDNDLTYFILYHLDVMRKAVASLNDYVKRKTEEIQVIERQLRATATVNHRQLALISHALRHRDQIYTIESHRRSHNVVYQTARLDLLDLLDLGILTVRKSGRTMQFRPAPDIDERLAELTL